jgi:hypothetical protein
MEEHEKHSNFHLSRFDTMIKHLSLAPHINGVQGSVCVKSFFEVNRKEMKDMAINDLKRLGIVFGNSDFGRFKVIVKALRNI